MPLRVNNLEQFMQGHNYNVTVMHIVAIFSNNLEVWFRVRATSHTRLRARDHYTSSTLIGGKGGHSSSFKLRLRDQRSM